MINVLNKMYDAQKHYFQTNNRYSDNLKDLAYDFEVINKEYEYGFNPKCFPNKGQTDTSSHPNFGFTKKSYFTNWLAQQPCRPNGYTFYGVKQKTVVEFEVHQINERKEVRELKIP